jgi:hypothetical protein
MTIPAHAMPRKMFSTHHQPAADHATASTTKGINAMHQSPIVVTQCGRHAAMTASHGPPGRAEVELEGSPATPADLRTIES